MAETDWIDLLSTVVGLALAALLLWHHRLLRARRGPGMKRA
jgi:hypothetical protein